MSWLHRLQRRFRRSDPVTFVGVCVLLMAVAALAAYLPRVDPVEALRADRKSVV